MLDDLRLGAHPLPHGHLHRIDGGRGRLVQCLEGRLWMTQQDDPRDLVLESGDVAVIERDGLTVLQALADARFVVSDGLPAALPLRPPHAGASLATSR